MSDSAVLPSARIASGYNVLPGLALTGAISSVAFALHRLPGLGVVSPLILAIILGMALHNVLGTPAAAHAGVRFALRPLLRLGIALLGLQLTAQQVAAVGARGIFVVLTTLFATFLLTKWLGRLLGVERKLAELIASGTAVCGASAVIATNTVTRGSDEDVAYAVACVTVFGSAAMLLYPMLLHMLHLTAHQFGLWAGASIHEIAQVIAAAFQAGREAGEYATIAKLSRVMMLAPLVLALGALAPRRRDEAGQGNASAPLPWFAFGFIALVGVNSLGVVPPTTAAFTTPFTTFLLAVALAAMGLETDLRKLRAAGLRPLALAAASSLVAGALSLALVKLVG